MVTGHKPEIQLQIYGSGNAREPDPRSGLNFILRIRPGRGMNRGREEPQDPGLEDVKKDHQNNDSPV